jgi:alkanesulfonate monooxygenase SsuD/methylene tetrahydromethanopterin reductase-like flavin-dependent oxidoreductase (luciferase family)
MTLVKDNTMRFGLLLPAGGRQLHTASDTRGLIELAVEVERLGFDSIWAGDSLSRGRVEPLVLLSAVAAVTERITIGTAALLPAFRHPVPAAQALSSLDLLSSGRLVVAVGGGFPGLSEPEFELVGVEFRTRFSWLEDVVALWRQLWSAQPSTAFHGKLLHYDWLPAVPAPYRSAGPPIWLAGATPAALARTGRNYDGWLPYPPAVAGYAAGLDQINAAATEAGRDPTSVTPALFATILIDDDPERGMRALDEYCQATYRLPMDTVAGIQLLITGSADEVAARLAAYRAAGARHIAIRIATLHQDVWTDQLGQLAGLLLPAH